MRARKSFGNDSRAWRYSLVSRLPITKVCAVFAAMHCLAGVRGMALAQSVASTQPSAAMTEHAVDDAAVAEQRVHEHLSEAERILTIDAAPALFRDLCDDSSSRPALVAAAHKAQEQLQLAATSIKSLGATESRDALEVRHDQLETFAHVFASLGGLTEDSTSRGRVVTACGDLAALFDAEDKALAESAKLWQGAAYRRAGRSDRALQVLRPIVNRPSSPVIGFWARLERARALGDMGRFAAGIALCQRLEALAPDWFKQDPEQSAAAKRTVRQVRAALLNQWAKQLEAAGRTTAAHAAASKARELAEELVRVPESKRLLKLEAAIETTQAGETDHSIESVEDEPASPDEVEAGDPADSEQFDEPDDEAPQDDDTGV